MWVCIYHHGLIDCVMLNRSALKLATVPAPLISRRSSKENWFGCYLCKRINTVVVGNDRIRLSARALHLVHDDHDCRECLDGLDCPCLPLAPVDLMGLADPASQAKFTHSLIHDYLFLLFLPHSHYALIVIVIPVRAVLEVVKDHITNFQ